MALDSAIIYSDHFVAPPVHTGKPRPKSSEEPINVLVASTSGVRSNFQNALLHNFSEITGLSFNRMFHLGGGPSGGALAVLSRVMPCQSHENLSNVTLLEEFALTTRAILTRRGKLPLYSTAVAERLLQRHWGDATLADAKTGLAVFTYDSIGKKTVALTNLSGVGDAPTSHVKASMAGAATLAIPRLFKEIKVGPWSLSDGFREAAFPIVEMIELAKVIRGDTNRPINVIGISAGYSPHTKDYSRWLAPKTCFQTATEQKYRQIAAFERMKARGEVDGFIVNEDLSRFAPEISESPIDASPGNIVQCHHAAERIAHKYERHVRDMFAPMMQAA